MSKESLGEFERLVLLAILHLGTRAYGATIIQELERRTGRTASAGAMYVALKRLERKGSVSSELGAPSAHRGGRPKRYFTVRQAGVDILRKARDAYRRAGYGAMAMELQERILRDYQLDDRHRELMTLARYNKEVKRYDEAIRQLDAAAEAATTSKEKLVAHSYRSWYTELGQGAAAGLAAYRQAEQYAAELGMSDDIATTKIRDKIDQLQKIVAATQN